MNYFLVNILIILLVNRSNRYSKLSLTDELTSLDNRRKFNIDLNHLSNNFRKPTSLIMFDIDNFKKVNDVKGHPFGDIILKELSTLIQSALRQPDFLSRIGGEEFIIMIKGINEKQAYKKAEELRLLVEEYVFSDNYKITISLGVYEILNQKESKDTILSKVDEAMYKSKENGRNQTTTYTSIL